ncbi:MAG: hypothetical protein K6E85_02045 [Lachnospiraceae bacterium]|nr:hypothetical protein [Lachnospiraceae bacterium]
MSQVSERTTRTNIIRYYEVPFFTCREDAVKVVSDIRKIKDYDIREISITDTTDRFSEGAQDSHFDGNSDEERVSRALKSSGVNFVTVIGYYNGIRAVIGLDYDKFRIVITTSKTKPADVAGIEKILDL